MTSLHNVKEFNLKATAFAEKLVPEQFVLFHASIVGHSLASVVEITPVRLKQFNKDGSPRKNQITGGRARSAWQVTIGSVPTEEQNYDDPVGEGLAQLVGLQPYSAVWITNNVFYIEFLDAGSSTQAPRGIISVTLGDLLTIFR